MSSSKLSKAVLSLIAAGATSVAIMAQFISEKESSGAAHLKAYQDGARIWTICDGKTEGVTKLSVMTRQQCDDWRKTEIGKRLAVTHAVIRVPMSEAAWAGFGSFCFNVGNSGCAKSTAAKLINRGEQEKGCKAMLNWRFITRDGKKIDCSTDQPYCKGLWERRQEESELCQL